MVETVKMISASDAQLKKRFVPNKEMLEMVLEQILLKGRNVQIHAMHNFNWEVVNLGVSKVLGIPFVAPYMPIANKHLERIFQKMRCSYGTVMVPATEFKKNFLKFEKEHIKGNYAMALVADQNPGSPAHAWWLNFFNRPTAFVTGPEKAARLRSLPVIFGNFYKVKRGVYTFELSYIRRMQQPLKKGN